MRTCLPLIGLAFLTCSASAAPPSARTPGEAVARRCVSSFHVIPDGASLDAYLGGRIRSSGRKSAWIEDSARDRRWLDALPNTRLRALLVPLFSQSDRGYPVYISAAYHLARRGIDVRANVERMMSNRMEYGYALYPGKDLDHELADEAWDSRYEAWGSTYDWLPRRLVDVYHATHDPSVLSVLLGPLEVSSENRARWGRAIVGLTTVYPREVLASALLDQARLTRLAEWLRTADLDPDLSRRLRLSLDRTAHSAGGRTARAAAFLRRDFDQAGLLRDCLLLAGGWNNSERAVGNPKNVYEREMALMHAMAIRAERRFGVMSKAALRTALEPLFARLAPHLNAQAAVAWVLATHGVDGRANVARVLSVMRPLARGHEAWPKPTRWETAPWPGLGSVSIAPEDWPHRFVPLYEATKDQRILEFFLEPDILLDGCLGEGWPYAIVEITRVAPDGMVRLASRSGKGTRTLSRILAHPELSREHRNGIRPALYRIAAGRDSAMTRTARLCLERMRETGRGQEAMRARMEARS